MKTLGEAIAVIEEYNRTFTWYKFRLSRIAPDRWAVLVEHKGTIRTLATGEDILAAYKNSL